MALKNEYVIYTARNFTTGLLDVTADIRRNGTSVATGVALSDIGDGRYQLLLTPALLTGYGGAGYYDFYIDSASKSAPAVTARWILENDSDDLESHLTTIESKIDTVDTVVDGIALDTTSIKSTVEDTNTQVNDGSHGLPNLKTLIDNITSVVTNISNVTRFSAPIPKPLIRLGSGTKTYKIPVYLYDTNGNMEDPDLNQIELQLTDESGASRDTYISGFTTPPYYITRNAQGQYEFDLDIPDTAGLEQINFKFIYQENSITLTQGASTEIIQEAAASGFALETTAQDILTDTADMQPRVTDIQTKVNDATYGLAALKTLLDTIDANTDGVEAELANATYGLSALRTQLDLKASQSSVNAVQSSVDSIQGTGYVEVEDSLEAISDRVYTGGQAV
jgi:translation elongation factor EF-1beta